MATRTLYTSTALEVLTSANLEKFPKGWIGYAEVTANQTGIGTSTTDLTGLSVTVDLPANRMIRISGKFQIAGNSAPDQFIGRIREGSTSMQRWQVSLAGLDGTARLTLFPSIILDGPSAGSHSYKLSGNTTAGTVNMEAGAEFPAYILVEDLGPASS